jgi:hypothetical protein
MQSPKRFMLTTLAVILLFIGSAQSVLAQDADFEVDGSVMSSHLPDDTYVTVLGVSIRNFTGGTLPDDIGDVVFEGPSGIIASLGDPGVEFYQPDSSYYFSVQGQPEIGTYTFRVTSTAATGSVERTDTDTQTVIREIPLPDETSFSPARDAVVSSITPIFSWDPVSYGDVPLYYRLQIQDAAGNMGSTPRILDRTSFVIQPGLLQPGQSYEWRVRVCDGDNWVAVENRSQSDWQPFTMAAMLDHPATPVVDLDNWGACTVNRSTGTIIDLYVKVIDHDGIVLDDNTGQPSHTVIASHPYAGTVPLNFDYNESNHTAYFYGSVDPGTAPLANYAGNWTFTVTDPAGNTASTVDNLTVAPLPYPDENTFVPSDGTPVADTTPTFTWGAVTATDPDQIVRYRVRIYTDDLSQTVWRGYATDTTYTVPPGVLAPGTAYRYRIDVFDAHSSFDTDNHSRAPADSANYLRFTTGSESPDPYIDLDSNGVHTWNGGSFGPTLSFWVRVFDPQGVPGDIASVKAILPGGAEVPLRYEYNEGANSAYYSTSTFDPLIKDTYTLRVEDYEGNYYTVDEDLGGDPIGFPDETTITPIRSTLVGSTAVHFDWEDVSGVAFYRIEIYDENFNRILYFYATESEFSLPEGYLEEGTYYAYRITSRSEFWDENVDHGSSSPRSNDQNFNFITTATAGSAPPTITTDNWGALLWHNPRPDDPATSNFWRAFNVRVTDADGPPHCIQKVEVTFPDGETKRILGYDGNTAPDAAYYWYKEDIANPADMPNGIYTFTVTDVSGRTASTTDNFTRNVLPQPTNLLPLPDSKVPGTTPTINWDPVPGAATYRVEIYNEAGNRIHRPYLTGTSYTVPAGVLELNQTYSYRIRAHREDAEVENMDNMSSSTWWRGLRPHFTTTDVADSDNDGISDTIENAIVCLLSNDTDSDDDGIPDGVEDINRNGIVDAGETSPCLVDTDGDGIQDGTESGLTTGDPDTNPAIFIPDEDPATTTDPLLADTDGDGILDGVEDLNQNGRVDPGEGDPNVKESKAMPWVPLLLLGN